MSIAETAPLLATHPRAARSMVSPLAAQVALMAVACAALAGGVLGTGEAATSHAVAQAGPDLARLLRAMAAIKAMMAAGAVAAILWRLQTPVSMARFALYAGATAGMAAGPALIWTMVHVAAGAFLLHAGLIASVVVLWLDPEVGRRLETLVARKRAALRR